MIVLCHAHSMHIYFSKKRDEETRMAVEEGLLALQREYPASDPAYRAIECLLEVTEAAAVGDGQKEQSLIAIFLRIMDVIEKMEA